MSEDRLPRAGTDDDVLRRAAREVRASSSLQALVPLSAAERERLADAAIEHVLGAAGAPAPASEPAVRIPAAVTPLGRPRSRARAVTAVVAASLALAAAVALYVRGDRRAATPPATYAMIVAGEQPTRGAAPHPAGPGVPVELRPETRLVITLASRQPERDVLLRLVLVRGGRATVLDPPVGKDQAGGLSIAGPAAELLGVQRDGPAELVVVLGRALPGDDALRALVLGAPGDAPRDLQVLRQAIRLAGF
jgi:hypothetical protein